MLISPKVSYFIGCIIFDNRFRQKKYFPNVYKGFQNVIQFAIYNCIMQIITLKSQNKFDGLQNCQGVAMTSSLCKICKKEIHNHSKKNDLSHRVNRDYKTFKNRNTKEVFVIHKKCLKEII